MKCKCNTIRHFMFLLDIYYLDIISLLWLPWKVKTNFLPSPPRSRLVMKHLPNKIIAALYAVMLHLKRGTWNCSILQGAGLPHTTPIAFTFLSFFSSCFATSCISYIILKETKTTFTCSTLLIDGKLKIKKSGNSQEINLWNRLTRENCSSIK